VYTCSKAGLASHCTSFTADWLLFPASAGEIVAASACLAACLGETCKLLKNVLAVHVEIASILHAKLFWLSSVWICKCLHAYFAELTVV